MDQNEPLVIFRNLSKIIKNKHLLYALDYKLYKGKVLALCGGNGAGKSTLICLITGILKPTTGHVTINRLDTRQHVKELKKIIGYMPDEFVFQNSLTTKETLSFYASIKNVSKQRYEEVLTSVGLSHQLNERVGSFSKGMKQRLLLAQALLNKPKILILDEPTNGLDPYWIEQFCEFLLQAKKRGQTIIFSTHDLHIAEQVADQVIFLKRGRMISEGAVRDYKKVGLYETFRELYFESMQQRRTR